MADEYEDQNKPKKPKPQPKPQAQPTPQQPKPWQIRQQERQAQQRQEDKSVERERQIRQQQQRQQRAVQEQQANRRTPQQQQRNGGGWTNPNKGNQRQQMDRRLEAAGLLKYQTKGLSAAEIAARYSSAGINVNQDWFSQNYGNAGGGGGIPQGGQGGQQQAEGGAPSVQMPSANLQQVLNGEANWTDIPVDIRKSILQNPGFYQGGKITNYSAAVQQQILADPEFKWDQLPKWQQVYYSMSSNPAAMGATQGLVMGAGNPAGAVLGTAMGWAAGVVGYDPTKEFWKQGDDNNKMDAGDFARGAFGVLNFAAEQAEKVAGLGVKIGGILTGNDPTFDPNKRNLDISINPDFNLTPGEKFNPELLTGSTWNAGASTFEVLAPAIIQTGWANSSQNVKEKLSSGQDLTMRDILRFVPAISGVDMFLNPEQYKGDEYFLGAAAPIELQKTFYERFNEAEAKIKAGANYREVATEFQAGIMAQVGDMAGQGIADPLNVVGKVEAAAGEVTARVTGDKIAAAAFSEADGIVDAGKRIQNIINTPGEAAKIDPNFKIDEMGWITKQMSGLTKDGKIRGDVFGKTSLLDYKPPEKNIKGFVESLFQMTPESRARTGGDLLVGNLGKIAASYFNGTDVAGFASWFKAFSNGDMTQAADLSKAVANAPEFYTVLPAAKGFDIDGQLKAWEASDGARNTISQIADILGENPMTMIEDMAKRGTLEQDFARIREKLAGSDTPEARNLLRDIDEGRLTPDLLSESVKAFADGSIPFHPGQWMAQTLGSIKDHYDQWAVNHFKLDAESRKTLFRVSSVMKSAQSILLLGANPGYMISNVLPTMVTRAATGVWGYMTPKAIDNFMTRMGYDVKDGFAPNRLEEGVGPAGDVGKVAGDPIRDATRGSGTLSKIENAIGKIGRNMPFNKLSRILEGYEGKQAFAVGMKKAWGEQWRRGKGFREIPAPLLAELTKVMGARAKDVLYNAIEAGMSKQEIQNIVSTSSRNVQSRALVNDAASQLNIPASQAASMLEQAGVFDALDANLKGANTQAKVEAAFERAKRIAKSRLDQQATRDAIAKVEHIANRVQTEGMKAVTDIFLDTEERGIDQWMQHYERMGEAAEAMDAIDNPAQRANVWALKYAESSAEYRRFNAQRAATYSGVMKAVGLDNNPTARSLLATMGETDRVMDNAYRTMRELRNDHFNQWNNDWQNPRQQVERAQVEQRIENIWKDATKREQENNARFGELMGKQYESLFGVEAGEAARQAWEQISAFRSEMTKRRDDFRKVQKQAQANGVPYAERARAAREFWQGEYKYMIVEMGRVKTEAINKLDKIARGGGNDPQLTGAPKPPTDPSSLTPEQQALRQQAEERAAAIRQQVDDLWAKSAEFGFSRERDSVTHHLLNTLKREEYGGDPTIRDLPDAVQRLTPEQIDNIFETRRQIKDAQDQNRIAERNIEYYRRMEKAKADANKRKPTRLLSAIKELGGIDWKYVSEITGEKNPPMNQKTIFSKTGRNRWGLDEMARNLADMGYPIEMGRVDDPDGIAQTIDLIRREFAGDAVYSMTDMDKVLRMQEADLAKAEIEFLTEKMAEDAFDPDNFITRMVEASEALDRNSMDNMVQRIPEEMMDEPLTITETYREYVDRVMQETNERIEADQRDTIIAENMTHAEAALREMQEASDAGMTRSKYAESLTDVFKLSDEEAGAWMEVMDGISAWYAKETGRGENALYADYIADVQNAGDIDLAQDAYHGSPYKFDKFTLDKIGSGEGAQAYGWGLYFAGDKAVADWYRQKLAGDSNQPPQRFYKGKALEPGTPEYHAATLLSRTDRTRTVASARKEVAGWIKEYQAKVEGYKGSTDPNAPRLIQETENLIGDWQKTLDLLNEATSKKDFTEKPNTGQLYKVELPDENYLLWDRPLSEQSEGVRQALLKIGVAEEPDVIVWREDQGLRKIDSFRRRNGNEVWIEPDDGKFYIVEERPDGSKYHGEFNTKEEAKAAAESKFKSDTRNGEDVYRAIAGDPKAASLALKEAGINGIQYLDGSSRGKGEGNYNYVVFDDNAINILETYYQRESQSPKGGVRFLEDRRAVIRAWDKADISTVIHENGHIFRRMLADMATKNPRFAEDLTVLERWAGVKNGEWTRAAEEKFARGFERYFADGTAPTPKLRAVFQKFKGWLVSIYKSLLGSPIDVELTPAVKEVFDRLLIGERTETSVNFDEMLLQMGYDPKSHYFESETGRVKRRGEVYVRFDKNKVAEQTNALLNNDFFSNLEKMKRGESVIVGERVDPTVPTRNAPTHELSYEEYKANIMADQRQKAQVKLETLAKVEAGELPIDAIPELTRDKLVKERNEDGYLRYKNRASTIPEVRAEIESMLSRNTISYELYGDIRATWQKRVEQALLTNQMVPENVKQQFYAMGKDGNLSRAEGQRMREAGRGGVQELFQMAEPTDPNILFQDADPRMPLGGYEEAANWLPEGDVMHEGWAEHIDPLLDKMKAQALSQLDAPRLDGAYKDLSPEGQRMMQNYLKGVQSDMASTKMSATRWGEQKRDAAMLNYNKRYGFDQWLDVVFPYQFFYTRSMMTWAQRAIDHPAWLSNYARIRQQQDQYENNLPERLRGKMRIEAPWMPDWMGDALYIDPLSVLFTPHNFMRPFEQMVKDQNYQTIEANRILQEWAQDGSMSADQIQQAAQTQSGAVWERALAEAKMRREAQISNPLDFVSATFGPAWYLTTPAKLLGIGKDGPETVGELPITRTARAFESVTRGTWAEPAGQLLGLLAKPEEAFREANNLPTMGEYGDYYIDRQLANMVAEGLITSEEAQIAMIERQGELFDEAKRRTELELAMRIPLMGAIYAGTHEGGLAALQALPPSLFGAGVLPEGELHYRGLKDEWNEAWKRRDAGDTEAINRFFEDHPEYEAYLAKGKEPEARLRSFLIGQIWDGYMELGETDRKLARAEMGDLFGDAFLNPETRSYDTLDIETLTQWAQMLNQKVPETTQTAPVLAQPKKTIDYFSPDVTAVTDRFFEQRSSMFPNYYEVERGYYNLPKSERAAYLVANPELKQYWDWKDNWYKRYPEYKPVFNGQVFKRIDTTTWNPLLVQYVTDYAYGGDRLPSGAYKSLEQEWIKAGRPRGSVDEWLKLDVVPAMLYQ